MSDEAKQSATERRSFLSRLSFGALGAAAATVAVPSVSAAATESSWRPARHGQDDWLDEIPGQHRVVIDATTPAALALALHFTPIYLAANRNTYKLQDSDSAIVIITRHKATSFGYNDTMWAKYGNYFSDHSEFTDPQTKQAPKVNVYTNAGIETLGKRGVHFAVCQMASDTIARSIAEKTGVEVGAVMKEFSSNMVANGRGVPAGIIAVNRAQERGYSLVVAG
jgi:hypothetical protein